MTNVIQVGGVSLTDINNIDASQITSGTIDPARLPQMATASGLSITVAPFALNTYFNYEGGSVTAIDNKTQYVGVNIAKKTLHMLPRQLDRGVIWIAKVVAVDGVCTVTQIAPVMPDCRIPQTFKKLSSGDACKIHIFGSSLEDWSGVAPYWWQLNLDSAQSAIGLNIAGVGSVTTYTGYAVSGGDAELTAAMLARPVISYGYFYDNTNLSYSHKTFALSTGSTPPSAHKMKRSAALMCDVAIIGLLANSTSDQIDVYEGAIRTLRKNGVEVVLVTDNSTSDGIQYYADGEIVAQLADKYGCHLADTAAYVKEQEWRGNNPWSDTIHMSAIGHVAWAHSVCAAFSTSKRVLSYSQVDKFIKSNAENARTNFEISLRTLKTTGSLPTPSAIAYSQCIADLYGETKQSYPFATGEEASIGHPMCCGMALIIDQSSNFTANVYKTGKFGSGTVESSISFSTTVQNRLGIVKVFKASSTYGSNARTVYVTSGTMKVVGVIYYTPDYDNIDQSEMQLLGSGWTASPEATIYDYKCKGTDTTNDSIVFGVEKSRGLAWTLLYKPTSGQVTEVVNNNAETTGLELYVAGGAYYTLRKYAGRPLGEYCAQIKLTGVNGSASAAGPGARRLMVPQVFAINDR